MYKAFSYEIDESAINYLTKRVPAGDKGQILNVPMRKPSLEAALSSLDSLNSTTIQDTWFTPADADVFISHSSKDEQQARLLASYLQRQFGVRAFIDSLMWRHMDEMLKKLDDRYCIKKGETGESGITYSYENRNVTTAHVHMLLAHALIKMIDAAECFIYLDTRNSTIQEDKTSLTTYSPWLYHELAIVDIIQMKSVLKLANESFSRIAMDSMPNLSYKAPKSKLSTLTTEDLRSWEMLACNKQGHDALCVLYRITK